MNTTPLKSKPKTKPSVSSANASKTNNKKKPPQRQQLNVQNRKPLSGSVQKRNVIRTESPASVSGSVRNSSSPPYPTHKQPVRKALSTEEKRKRNAIKAARRKKRRLLLLILTALFLTFYLVFSLLFCSILYFDYHRTYTPAARYTYVLTTGTKRLATIPPEKAYINGIPYISFANLDKLCNFSVLGDRDCMTVLLRESNDVLICNVGASAVVSNGINVSIGAPVLYIDNDYYLPMTMLNSVFGGINTEVDQKTGACTITLSDPDSYLTLLVKHPALSEPVSEPELLPPTPDA